MSLCFTAYIARLGDEVRLSVVAEATFDRGEPGTLADPAGWRVEITEARDAGTGRDYLPELSADEHELLQIAALAQL